jgi:thiol-disulfide isomerase/thioredoxin
MSTTLATMDPDADATVDPDVTAALGADGLRYKVWGGDWCPDCTQQLPQFAAALGAAGVSSERVEQFPVEKVDGEKRGPRMDEYGVEYIPTVIVFDAEGDEVARFVESADTDIATYLARELAGN